jgi:transposase
MFSYVSPEQRVPIDHPLRSVRALVDDVLREMSREFDGLYAAVGRPSIPPERLLRAQLLQIFYSIRSERLLMEQLHHNLLFRWFVAMEMDEPIWNPTVFTKNRDRLLNQDIARSFFRRVVDRATEVMSDEHFTVDGTLLRRGRARKAFSGKMAARAVMAAILKARRAETTRTPRRPTRTPGCIANHATRRRASCTWAIC